MKYLLIILIFLTTLMASEGQKKRKSTDPPYEDAIQSFTKGMIKKEGFFDFYYNENDGKLFVGIDRLDEEFLYVNSLAAGVGSNDIGLDRGQLGQERVVKFQKFGDKVFLIQPNQDYRAVSENPNEVKSVEEAFASSILGGFKVEHSSQHSTLIDATDFLLRDSHGVRQRLKMKKQGDFTLDKTRSAIFLDNTFNFPMNTEFESILTFKGIAAGDLIPSVVPTSSAITVRTHHSFIQLPDDGYVPREFDPRSGFIYISYQDYATPIERPLTKRFILRHRLEKKNPDMMVSEPIEPIVYYLDRGAPEPIRSALIEGATWWGQAFEAAGFKSAFRVELLPEHAHPLDVRYNMIQWVHRSTRGWSYGASVIDPRTGEIIKGHVSLGSLRVRQDFLIAEGLLNPYDADQSIPPDMKEMALARLRQLSAHEVGHTIGLVHNFSSSYNDRASVMDYPHPYIQLDENGKIDLSKAYDTNIGAWDKIAIQFGYGVYKDQDHHVSILEKAIADGFKYITDRDARPMGGANPYGHLWDNGANASDELNRMMKIRRKILDGFSEKAIQDGMPMSSIEEVLVPMYLFHRYQVDAASKTIGGLNYTYAVKGDGQLVTAFINESEQMKSLSAIVATMQPAALKLSEELLMKIPPKVHGYSRTRESFQSMTGPVFDYFAAVKTAASLPMGFLFHVERANRLEMYKSRNADQPGFGKVLRFVIRNTWEVPSENRAERALQEIVEQEMLQHMMSLYLDKKAYPSVKAILMDHLKAIRDLALLREESYYKMVSHAVDRFLKDPMSYEPPIRIKAPDGSPIGDHQEDKFCSFGY